ncbi:hypothetical protein SNOG_12919 [Parastagonospora nodorum SN15]|uniref:Methyltransferase domain-containing protein n=1 Tax=Phaeosphaeria nodorum (strain SN15 / ATCC MYA-4574 / FGSC 10173) TaxID=321614 RepID=Q0U5P5_PHANO|nr:hypothetical protein SNOG_12919 [Parastagonospora nodorum SN15]EAT79719.2 hypothetical protein SNOG_12919 [Parastagonospora nodorum SN15]
MATRWGNYSAFDFHAASVTGVDIDPKLVGQANKLLALRASRTRPPTKDSERIVDWFPMSAVLDHGYIEPQNDALRGSTFASPHSSWPCVRFHSADWAIDQDCSGPYDVILALSTWDSYEKAIRPQKAPHFLQNFNQLQYRPETSFDELLAAEGLQLCASSLVLPRPIKVYRKRRPGHDDSTS